MSSHFLLLSLIIVATFSIILAKNGQTALLLALVELTWVCLCGVGGVLFINCGDLFFLYGACVLLFFSAVELVVSAVLLMLSNSQLNKPTNNRK